MAIQIAEEQGNAEMDKKKLSRRRLKRKKILEEKLAEDEKKETVIETPEEKPVELEIKKQASEEQPKEQMPQKETLEEKPIKEEKTLQESIEIEKEVEEEKSSIGKAMEAESSESKFEKKAEEEKGPSVQLEEKSFEEEKQSAGETAESSEFEEQPMEQPPEEQPEAEEGTEQIEFGPKSRAAVIEDVRIAKITSLWKKKPRRLSLESDAIIITLKTPDGKILKETFYTHIDSDNNLKYSHTNTANQQNFISFLQRYKLTENLENYNVTDGSKNWKGKTVELDENSKIVIK